MSQPPKTPPPVKSGVPITKSDTGPQLAVAAFLILLVIAIFVFLGN